MGCGDTKNNGNQWKLVARKTLSAQSADFDIKNLPTSKRFRIEFELTASGATDRLLMRFNNNSGTYNLWEVDVGGASGDELATDTNAGFLVWEFNSKGNVSQYQISGRTDANGILVVSQEIVENTSATKSFNIARNIDLGAEQDITEINFVIDGSTDNISGTIRVWARC